MSLSRFKIAAVPADEAGEEKPDNTLRNGLMAGVGAAPWLGLIKRPRIHEGKGVEYKTLEELRGALKPGHVLLSSPFAKDFASLGVALGTGTPDTTHAAFIDDRGRLISALSGHGITQEQLDPARTYTLLQPRADKLNPLDMGRKVREHYELAEKIVSDAAAKGATAEELAKLKNSFFATGQEGLLTAMREPMKPEFNVAHGTGDWAKRTFETFKKNPSPETVAHCMGAWCTGPGAFSVPEGMDVLPGKTPQQTAPSDYLKSQLYEPVGGFQRGRNQLIDKLLRTAPHAARFTYGAVGAGAIYGADKLLRHLKKRVSAKKTPPPEGGDASADRELEQLEQPLRGDAP